MNHILIAGGGLAGCRSALELADNGICVTIIEKSGRIGGKVRQYGCKASDECKNCGLCLVGDLWERVENHSNIEIITGARLKDVLGTKGSFTVIIADGSGTRTISGISNIVVSIGFDTSAELYSGKPELEKDSGIISGYGLELLLSGRSRKGLSCEEPSKIAFIQCFGSRDIQEKALYCSRVCCGYSTRAAGVLRKYYPDAAVTFFYMDIQQVEEGNYLNKLINENIEFIRCRPVSIMPGKPVRILYEQPGTAGIIQRDFDLVILSEGIRPPADADKIAELCMLGIDDNGFLKYVKDGDAAGIYLVGCVSGPKRIEEVNAEAVAAARRIIAGLGGLS